jgi:hypothetical protein
MTETDRHLEDLRAILDSMRAGRAADAGRLSAMAHRYLDSSREGRGRIDLNVFADLIRSEAIGRFVHQAREPDETQLARMLSAALRRAQVDIDDRTFYVPCRLFDGDEAASVAVGPVTFQRTAVFRDAHDKAIAADPELAALFRNEFLPWEWTAEVTVRGCDRIISRERALKAIDSALDMLRLFAGAAESGRLGRAGAPGLLSSDTAGLWTDPGGRLHLVRPDPLGPRSDQPWLKRTHEAPGRDWLDRAGLCLLPLVDPALHWPLADRFRQAASWFGEGVAESYRAARILAFVTSIERAVVPGDHAEVWRAVTRRAAILARQTRGGKLDDWLDKATRIYEIRSQIVHGGVSPFAPQAGALEMVAAELARATLHGALAFYESLGLKQAKYSADRLEKDFRKLEAEKLDGN